MVGVGIDMLQQMAEYRVRHTGGHMGIAGDVVVHDTFDDMVKKLAAHFLQKAVLGFKVGIEGASSYIGTVNNVLDGDFRVGLF